MGALQANTCFANSVDAVDAYYLSAPPQVTSGATGYVTQFIKEAGVWKSKGYTVSSTGVWTLKFTTNAPVPVFPYCDELGGLKDGISLGWMAATVIIAVAAIVAMKRSAK